jgi:hypothetical protein
MSSGESGGIGRRAGLRSRCLRTWGFESPLSHVISAAQRAYRSPRRGPIANRLLTGFPENERGDLRGDLSQSESGGGGGMQKPGWAGEQFALRPERTAALPAEVPLGAFPAGSEGTFIWLIARTLYKQ